MSQDDSRTPRPAEFKPSIRSGSLNIYLGSLRTFLFWFIEKRAIVKQNML